jgi:hypothetical protein
VRIAELTAGAEAILFACQEVANEKEALLLGLPLKCQPTVLNNKVYLRSLIEGEHDIRGFGVDAQGVLTKVKLIETLNPVARGFRAIKIKPKI